MISPAAIIDAENCPTTVRALVKDGAGRGLLLRRSAASRRFAGQWEWPGGKAKLGEAPIEALKREVREETGWDVEVLHELGAYPGEVDGRAFSVFYFEAQIAGGTLRLSDEHEAARWLSLPEMLHLDLIPGLSQFISAYLQRGRER